MPEQDQPSPAQGTAWLEVRFECDQAEAEAWCDALIEAGAMSAAIEDADAGSAAEAAIFGEPGQAPQTAWPRNRVTALIDLAQDPATLVARALQICGFASAPAYRTLGVPARDWVRETQAQFEPIQVSPRLWIVPTWHDPPRPPALAVRVDPGLAFGTGSHPTTRLCLEWLDAQLTPGESLLDYGCGSGILAIAAAKLGASPVYAVDIDAQAVAAARDNVAANHCAVEVRDSSTPLDLKCAVVVANILANPLRVLAPALAGHVTNGGRLVLSGILETQADELMARYLPWMALSVFGRSEGWVCLHGRKP
ncbi:MAG: 50S ribosomal protein L11 methyltransferase [Burkholderiales bacterium]|nr:50S ribosomal protein L11 methyltransferase [Burkholderiales bacterium]